MHLAGAFVTVVEVVSKDIPDLLDAKILNELSVKVQTDTNGVTVNGASEVVGAVARPAPPGTKTWVSPDELKGVCMLGSSEMPAIPDEVRIFCTSWRLPLSILIATLIILLLFLYPHRGLHRKIMCLNTIG